VSEFHAEALKATMSEGLAQGAYLALRVEFEPSTQRKQRRQTYHRNKTPHNSYSISVTQFQLLNFSYSVSVTKLYLVTLCCRLLEP